MRLHYLAVLQVMACWGRYTPNRTRNATHDKSAPNGVRSLQQDVWLPCADLDKATVRLHLRGLSFCRSNSAICIAGKASHCGRTSLSVPYSTYRGNGGGSGFGVSHSSWGFPCAGECRTTRPTDRPSRRKGRRDLVHSRRRPAFTSAAPVRARLLLARTRTLSGHPPHLVTGPSDLQVRGAPREQVEGCTACHLCAGMAYDATAIEGRRVRRH